MFDHRISIASVDPELNDAIEKENQRQQQHIELIASESSALLDLSIQQVSTQA